jgi:hypothetical protein
MSRGILVGCDKKQEWMLPWWLFHFKLHNKLPVAFVDFGMTSHAKKWCKTHGILIPLKAPQDFVYPKSQIASELSEKWEKRHGTHFWSAREGWFYKPFALLQTPFNETIWIDLDCEVLGSLEPIFNKLHRHSQIALVRENGVPFEDVGYNSGLIVYHAKSPLLMNWASCCIRKNHLFSSDHEVLSHLIQEGDVEISELPSKYNWVIKSGINPDAVVIHWSGHWGKQIIRNMWGAKSYDFTPQHT